MLAEVGTTISTIGLLLQLRQGRDEKKLREVKEYKDQLRNLVSALYFSKSIHNLAHTILDLNCADIFSYDIREIGIIDFRRSFEASFGHFLQSRVTSEIYPNLPFFKSLILKEPEKYPIEGLSSGFIAAVNSLNYCFPKMIDNYESLHETIEEMLNKMIHLNYDEDFEYKLFKNFEENKGKWRHYIILNSKEVMTYADQTLLNGITILDSLFIV